MSASASPEAAFGSAPGAGPKVIRSVGSCFGWLLLSFGLWSYAWIYDNLTEIGNARGKDTQAALKTVLYLIPIVNIWVLYEVWKEIDEFAKSTGDEGYNVILYVILGFIPIVNIFILISVQNKINETWGRATNGAAQKADLGTLGLVTVIVGVLFWVLYIGIFILAGALSS
jgi:hypothetical protein